MFTASGLQVRFLKIIEKSNYQTARACADAGHGFCLQPISVLTLCFAGQVGEVHHKERRISVQSVASVCCNKVKLRATGIPLGSFVMNHVYTFARIIKT